MRRRVVAVAIASAAAGCGGDGGVRLDDAAAQRAKAHVTGIYSGACAPEVCERHEIRPWMRWVVQGAELVDGCEPEWPEVDAPGGDCVEVLVGGAGCGPDESSGGKSVRQQQLRAVRVWLRRDGERWEPAQDAWQLVGGSVGDSCR